MKLIGADLGLLVLTVGLLLIMIAMFGAGGNVAVAGVILIFVGALIAGAMSRKTCPQCVERVKARASKCRYCGHEFGAVPVRARASEPFYK